MDDQRIARIEDKVDDVQRTVGSINVTLAAQHESLKEHMRRTQLLEDAVGPITKHVSHVEGGLKLLGVLTVLVGVITGVFELLSKIPPT